MALNEYGTGVVNGYDIGPDADLMGADLSGAYLKYADLRGANLNYADLSEANLYGADLRGATMVGTIINDAMFGYIKVDAHNLHYFEAEIDKRINYHFRTLEVLKQVIPSIEVSGAGRTENPGRHLVVELRYVGGGGRSMGIPRYCVVDEAAPANRMMGPGGHYSEAYAIATFDNRAAAEEYIRMVNGDRATNPGYGHVRGPRGYKY